MRVALDATALVLSTGGLARYAAELSRALADNCPDDDFMLLGDRPFPMPSTEKHNLHCGGLPHNGFERRWWLWGVNREMRRQRCELFHGTNFSTPYMPLRPSVITVHDLSPWMNPEWQHGANRVRQRTPPLLRLGIATMIITPTQAVRTQVIEHFRAAPGRVAAVPHGASEIFRPLAAPPSMPYFLYVGTLEPRKNVNMLIEAWRAVRHSHSVDLILAGRRRADFSQLPPEPGLRLLGEVGDAELARLYSGSLAFVYPSHYEGFGLPVLEAMQCGACVFVSRDAAVREVAGDAGVSLGGATEWTQAMSAAVSHPAWLEERRAKSLIRACDFSWARTARLTRDVYEEANRRFLG